VHFNIKAFNCCKVISVPPFGTLIKKIKVASYRKHFILKQEQQEEMRFQKRQTGVIKRATFLPIIPSVRQVIPSTDKDKTDFITFELKVRAGTGTGTPSYKKFMKTFEEGSPQEWMDVLTGLKEIWRQNSVNGATDCAATISAILKGDSLTAFETAMEDARVDPDPEEDDEESAAPLDMTNEMVETCLRSVTETVFPFPTFPSAFQKKKPAKVKAVASKEKSIFYDLMDEDSEEEEDEVMNDDSDNKATEEELAFLKSIDKEEKKAASKADQSDQESK
jgi:hypothetical protein